MIGLRVGPFEIEGEATVPVPGTWFFATRTGTTRRRPTQVLVKLLGPDAPQSARTALQAEFDALRRVEDPRVPSAVGYYEGTGAMVVEAVGGAPLAAIVAHRRAGSLPMTPATLCDLGLDLSECLQHAHHKGAVHGHLDPDKLWLSPEGKLWVWGFGSAGAPQVGFTPPERARGLPASPATDQWSLGAVLAALVTGKAPWTSVEEARRGASDALVDAIEVQWPALGRLLRRMLDPEPSRRFADLGPVRQELLALSREAGGLSERRELAVALAEHALSSVEPAPAEPDVDGPSAPRAASPLPTEDDVTVRQAPPPAAEPPDLAEAEAREIPMGRLASPGTLADESIPVVRPDLTEDLPAAQLGTPAVPEEPPMSGKREDKPDTLAGAVPDPADADTTRMKPVPAEVEYAEDDDSEAFDEEATQIVDSEAVQRAIREARAAAGLDEDTAATAPPVLDREHGPDSFLEEETDHPRDPSEASTADARVTDAMREAARSAEMVGAHPTNPTAVPWTDSGGEYGKRPDEGEAPRIDKVVLPEDGPLPEPAEPRGLPRNQQIAIAAIALMILTALLYIVIRM